VQNKTQIIIIEEGKTCNDDDGGGRGVEVFVWWVVDRKEADRDEGLDRTGIVVVIWGDIKVTAREREREGEREREREREREGREADLQKSATLLLLGGGATRIAARRGRHDDGADGLLEDALETLLRQGRALEVHLGANLLSEVLAVLGRGDLVVLEALERLLVVAEIDLGADEHGLGLGAVVRDLGIPLGLDVVERRRSDDREAQEEDIGLGVRESTQTRVLLLTGRIPERKVDELVVDLDTGRKVVEHSRHVVDREAVLSVRDQERGLALYGGGRGGGGRGIIRVIRETAQGENAAGGARDGEARDK